MKLVSIVIVNFNKNQLLAKCLDSIRIQTYPEIETIVVDNGSSDGSQNLIKMIYPEVRLITNKENGLYCQGQNQGVRESKGNFIICLNNDVILEKNYILELIKAINQDQGIGMATGKILSFDKKMIDTTGQFLSKQRTARERGYQEVNNGQFEEPGYVFGVPGVASLYRKEMFEMIRIDTEYFDSSYGLFYEDLDISWRAANFGWKAFYNPKAVAYHIRGGTAKTELLNIKYLRRYYLPYLSDELQFHLLKNRYMTMVKNDSLSGFLSCLGNIIFYDLKLWSYILLFRPKIILKIPQIVKYIKMAFQKRKAINIKLKMSKANL